MLTRIGAVYIARRDGVDSVGSWRPGLCVGGGDICRLEVATEGGASRGVSQQEAGSLLDATLFLCVSEAVLLTRPPGRTHKRSRALRSKSPRIRLPRCVPADIPIEALRLVCKRAAPWRARVDAASWRSSSAGAIGATPRLQPTPRRAPSAPPLPWQAVAATVSPALCRQPHRGSTRRHARAHAEKHE